MTRDAPTLSVLCWATAALGLAWLIACVAGRLLSPWPLEWMEGASVQHALRLWHGAALYAPPQAQFIPFVYPPLGYVPMALGLWLSRGALWGARLASVVALVLCLWSLVRAAQRLSGSSAAGLLAAGLFALGYGYTGGFLDLARIDAWFIALSLCGVERSCARRPAQALACFVLASLAKQHGLLLLAAASGSIWLAQGRRALPSIASAWLALALAWLLLSRWSDGWLDTYCLRVPARHGVEPALLGSFLLVDLGVYLPLLSVLALDSLAFRRDACARRPLCILVVAAVAASALGRAHPGGDDNVRLPAYALLVLVGALGFVERYRLARAPGRGLWAVAMLVQVGMLVQSPTLYWPSSQTNAGFSRLVSELSRCAGGADFVAMDHTGLGRRPFVHTLALSDLRMNHDALARRATSVVLAALRAGDAPAAFAISASFPALSQLVSERYAPCARLPPLRMPTGYALPATFVYKRRGL